MAQKKIIEKISNTIRSKDKNAEAYLFGARADGNFRKKPE